MLYEVITLRFYRGAKSWILFWALQVNGINCGKIKWDGSEFWGKHRDRGNANEVSLKNMFFKRRVLCFSVITSYSIHYTKLYEGFHSQEIMVCFVVTKWCEKEFLPIAKELQKLFPDIKSVVMNKNSKNTNVVFVITSYSIHYTKLYEI